MNMFCATCNLHFPDHLNFCRRCGQTLVRSTAESAIESLCCTRCGARVVRGENFCQQCGYRLNLKTQETVVGACYHCGTSWRSGWLFCKVCGLDRDQALLAPVSAPAAVKTGQPARSAALDELPRVERVDCPHCGVEAKPFSRFCEGCGRTLGERVTGGLQKLATVDRLRTKFDSDDAEPAAGAQFEARPTLSTPPTPPTPPTSATPFDPPSSKPLAVSEPSVGADRVRPRRRTVGFDPANETEGSDVFERPAGQTGKSSSAQPTRVNTSTPTIQPPQNNATATQRLRAISARLNSSAAADSQKRSERAGAQTAIFVVAALLAIGGIAWWWLLRSRPTVSQPTSTQSAGSSGSVAPVAVEAPGAPLGDRPAAVTAPEGMVYVPGGTFQLGWDKGDRYERPAYYIVVEPFFIDRTEVTNEEYQRFVAATGHRAPSHWPSILKDGKFPEDKAKQPVVNVSWDDAGAYARWANKRLPTEPEWEFAARGKDGRLYPWGNDWKKEAANAGHGKAGSILEVGGFSAGASPFGALDMCGNVWEWTADNLFSYANKNKTLAPGKVIRGGAYDAPKERATATYRGVVPPDKTYDKTGFRCARSVK